MDVTRIVGLLSQGQNVPIVRLKVQPQGDTVLSQDLVILSGENADQQKLINDALAFALVDRMRKLQGVVERLENLQVTAQFVSTPPVSQVLVDFPAESPDEAGRVSTAITLINAPGESPAASSSATVEFLLASFFGDESFFNPPILGDRVDVTV